MMLTRRTRRTHDAFSRGAAVAPDVRGDHIRRLALLIALALLTVLPAVRASAAETDRIAGSDRIGTAVSIAERAFPDGADSVYLARANVLSDALVAGTLTDGPILLVPSCGEIPPGVTNQVERLAPKEVVALGGEQAICDATLDALGASAETSRLADDNRSATAVAIAARAFPDGAGTIYAADAADSPDAVPGGSLTDGPILLVPSDGTPDPSVVDTVAALDPAEVVALGGTAAFGDDNGHGSPDDVRLRPGTPPPVPTARTPFRSASALPPTSAVTCAVRDGTPTAQRSQILADAQCPPRRGETS